MNNIIIILPILCILFLLLMLKRIENFDTTTTPNLSINELERELSKNILEQTGQNNNNNSSNSNSNFKNTDLERVARAVAKEYCPVGSDYDPTQYIKKTKLKDNCPKVPNLEDYIHKSAQQPQQKCPACICPDINLDLPPRPTFTGDKCSNLFEKCKSQPDFLKQVEGHFPAPRCPPEIDIKIIKENLISELKCPGPKPCAEYKSIIPLIETLLKNKTDKNTKILEFIKQMISNSESRVPTQAPTHAPHDATTENPTTHAPTTTYLTTHVPTHLTTQAPSTTQAPTQVSTQVPVTTLSDISAKNNNYYRQNNVTIAPSNINNLRHVAPTPERRAENIHYQGESDDSTIEEDELFPASNSDICKSSPLKI